MLWDLIRDFFVTHVFGGMDTSHQLHSGFIGRFLISNADEVYEEYVSTTDNFLFSIGNGNFFDGEQRYFISLGDWLSTTATIISISIIVVLCCLFVYKIIKLIGGLIR